MRSIQRLLGLPEASPGEDTETVRRIARELAAMDPLQARYLAAFAYVLARVAHADLELSAEEIEHLETLIAREGGLQPAQAALVARLATDQVVRFGGTEDYLVMRQFVALATREQCCALVSCLYQVAAASGSISAREDGMIRTIAGELRLTHAEVLALRQQFRSSLAELRDLPKGSGGNS